MGMSHDKSFGNVFYGINAIRFNKNKIVYVLLIE